MKRRQILVRLKVKSKVNLWEKNESITKKVTFPFPKVLVGVLTEMKIRSASFIAVSMSVEKNRLRPRHSVTTSSRPG
jgi:hypothetical protein